MRIKELTPLRFVLIMMIFFHHSINYAGGGSAAVAFFFVLSGFCMMLGYKDVVLREDFSYSNYLKRRITRIYPLHWITLFVVLLLFFIGGDAISLKKLALNGLLLQSWVPVSNVYFSYNDVSWYLSTGLFSMLLFPMLVWIGGKLVTKQKIIIGIVLLLVYFTFAISIPTTMRHALLYINPVARLFDFILGMFVADFFIWLKQKDFVRVWISKHANLLDVIVVLAFIGLILESIYIKADFRLFAPVYWVLIAIILLEVTLTSSSNNIFHRILRCDFVQKATCCSFSFMMCHSLIISRLCPPPCADIYVRCMIQLGASWIVAMILYYLIENKLTKWIQTKI